jgi:hypothetical protein
MKRSGEMMFLTVLAVAMVGCGGSGGKKKDAGSAQVGVQKAVPAPDVAVGEFLDAVRKGDDKKAGELLTPLARKKTAESEMAVAPPGSKTASFKVGKIEYVEKTGARVASTWTDLDEEGKPHTDEICWLVRLERDGWRIAGMATKVFEDQPPLILNFEDPQDMLRKKELAEQEMRRRAGQSNPLPAPTAPPRTAGRDPFSQSTEQNPQAVQPGESGKTIRK